MGQWDERRSRRAIVLLSKQQQVPRMINAECQLFGRKGHFGNWFKESGGGRQWGLCKEMEGAGPFSPPLKWGRVKKAHFV